MNLNNYFDKIFCINLDSRPDRWKEVQKEFVKNKIIVERISSIRGSDLGIDFPSEIKEGAVGCSLSHLFSFKYAKQMKFDNFLLLEDDVIFEKDVNSIFSNISPQIPVDWDMLYLGGQHYHGMNLVQISENIFKCEYTLSTHSVAFRHTVYDRFINSLVDITKPCDVHYAKSHREINSYVIIPHLTWQSQSFSDVENAYVDYTFLKQHRYPQWGKP